MGFGVMLYKQFQICLLLCVIDRLKPCHAAKSNSPIKAERRTDTQLHKLNFLMGIRLHRGECAKVNTQNINPRLIQY